MSGRLQVVNKALTFFTARIQLPERKMPSVHRHCLKMKQFFRQAMGSDTIGQQFGQRFDPVCILFVKA